MQSLYGKIIFFEVTCSMGSILNLLSRFQTLNIRRKAEWTGY